VKHRAGSVVRLATPVKAWAQRFALISLVAAAFAIMLLGRAQSPVIERLRGAVADAVAPILDATSRPVATVEGMIAEAQDLARLRTENAELRGRNDRLMQWQAVARRLEAENHALRRAANVVADPAQRFLTARVIGDQGGAFARSVLVNAGRREGVERGQAAMTGSGLAGRVAELGERASRVLLVTDMNSRIPVLVGRSRDRAVLAGNNSPQPSLVYLAPRADVVAGDRVVTSGHGGALPPDLQIGVVASVGEEGIRVQPYVEFDRLEYVQLVDFELPRLLTISGTGGPGEVLP